MLLSLRVRLAFGLGILLISLLPVKARDLTGTELRDLVAEARALYAAGQPGPAYDGIVAALAEAERLGNVGVRDMAALHRWRLLYGLRAFETGPSASKCAPDLRELGSGLDAAGRAATASGDATLKGDIAHLSANLTLLSGDYEASMDQSFVAYAAKRAIATCSAAMSRQIGTAAALLARDTDAARQAHAEAGRALAEGACRADLHARQDLYSARLALRAGNFEQAAASLDRLAIPAGDADRAAADAIRPQILFYRAELLLMQGRYAEAEIINAQARAAFGPELVQQPVMAQLLHRAAIIRQELGDWPAAMRAYQRAIAALDCRLGSDHPATLNARREQALLLSRMGRHEAAIEAAEGAVQSGAAAGQSTYGQALNATAHGLVLHAAGGRAQAALAALDRGLAGLQGAPDSEIDQTPALVARAEIFLQAGDVSRAREEAERAITILGTSASQSVQRLGQARRLLAEIALAEGEKGEALTLSRENLSGIRDQIATKRRLATYVSALNPEETRQQIAQRVRLIWQTRADRSQRATGEEIFLALQLLSAAGAADAGSGVFEAWLAARPDLADLVRRSRHLRAGISGLERTLRHDPDREDAENVRAAILADRARLDRIQSRLDAHPEAGGLRRRTEPQILSLTEAQVALENDQALWLNGSFEAGSIAMLVAPDGFALAEAGFDAEKLGDMVGALRRQVDLMPGQLPKAEHFPADAAYQLHCALVAPFLAQAPHCASETTVIGRARLQESAELLILPDGAMQQLPLALLLTEPMAMQGSFEALRDAPWLFRRNPLATIVSVALLRDRAGRPAATAASGQALARPFVGFAPYGPFGAGRPCDEARQPVPVATPPNDLLPGGIDPGHAFRQARLPHTVEMVREAAASFGAAPARDWFACETATETAFKAQDLSSVDTLVLATHAEVGTLPPHLAEPGLYMAAPARATAEDDGYIRASEISRTRMDADLVVLSACSTASDSGLPGAPGLSGLAQAFFEAGAGTLVVSHWDVASVSSARLLDGLLVARRQAPNRAMSRILTQAIEQMLADPAPDIYAHPFFWAPFVTVLGR